MISNHAKVRLKKIRFDIDVTQCANFTVYSVLFIVSCVQHFIYVVFSGKWIAKCEQSSYFLKVDKCHLIQMEISWWTRPSVHELRYLAALWGDSVCRSLPRMDERASAKFTAEQAKTATQLFPTGSPPRPQEQADEERRWWALEQDWNVHEICFIPSNNLRCALLQSRQSSWGLLLSCLPIQQTPERFRSAQAPKLASKLEICVFHCWDIYFSHSPDPCNPKITLVLENIVLLVFSLNCKVWFPFTKSIHFYCTVGSFFSLP